MSQDEIIADIIAKAGKGCKRIAVENFLMSVGKSRVEALMNLEMDAASYRWNAATVNAIRKGILILCPN